MLIISKKRMLLILTVFMLSIATYTVNIKKEDTLTTSSLPVTNKVIILDARASESQMREHLVAVERRKRLLI